MIKNSDIFLTAIYDRDPVEKMAFDNVILIGDGAHSIRPHGGQACTMSIKDAYYLGELFKKIDTIGVENAFKEFNDARVEETSFNIEQSRKFGKVLQKIGYPEVNWDLNRDYEKELLQIHFREGSVFGNQFDRKPQEKCTISTHVLDSSIGKPAANVPVLLESKNGENWVRVTKEVTNNDGRIKFSSENNCFTPGFYRLTFETEAYFNVREIKGFYPYVNIIFEIKEGHYHVPLLLSPWGYSTYRGS